MTYILAFSLLYNYWTTLGHFLTFMWPCISHSKLSSDISDIDSNSLFDILPDICCDISFDMYTCIYIYIYIYVHVYIYNVRVYIYIHICTSTYVCIYIYTCTYIICTYAGPIWQLSYHHVSWHSNWHITSKHIPTTYLTCSLDSGILPDICIYVYYSILIIYLVFYPAFYPTMRSGIVSRSGTAQCICGKKVERKRKEKGKQRCLSVVWGHLLNNGYRIGKSDGFR